jgi:hypothetical protein
MSLLDEAKKEAKVEGTVATEATPKKKSNSEYQKRQRALAAEYGQKLKAYFGDKVPEELKEVVAFFAKEKKAGTSASFGKPVIYKLFGDAPKKGAKITAIQVFENTGKGFAEMRQLMKKWSKTGIEVKYDEAAKAYVLNSDIPAFAN